MKIDGICVARKTNLNSAQLTDTIFAITLHNLLAITMQD